MTGRLAVLLLACGISAAPAQATSLIVPDQAPTIQTALDAGVDTVLVRPGTYNETPVTWHAIALIGLTDGPPDMPVLDGMEIHADDGAPFHFQRIQFNGTVNLASGGPSDFHFVECDLRSKIIDSWDHYDISFSKCRLTGPLDLWSDGIQLESCDVAGSIVPTKDSCPVIVRYCTIEGGGVYCPGNSNSIVEGNVIRGGGFGVSSHADFASIANNLIEDCQGDGVVVDYMDATITDNRIMRCGGGINVSGINTASIVGNFIGQARYTGLVLPDAGDVEVIDNVFWMCGADGMRTTSQNWTGLKVRNNTSCFNGGSGFVSNPDEYGSEEWTGNIGYANGRYGFEWLRPASASFACNDWFANQLGQVAGRPLSSDEFSADPSFCDESGGDFHLSAASPLLKWPGCGLVGALGSGCGAVAVGEGAAPAGFALTRVGPVPTRGPLALELTLPRAAAIEVTVHDVQGRMIARLASGEWSSGRHPLEWNGAGARGRVPPGLYLIRYHYPGGETSRRFVIAR